MTWRTYFISFTVQYCFLLRFVCIELVSLIWFLQIWVSIYVYGTLFNWSPLIKKLMQTYIVKVSGSILNISTVYLNGIWHLIWCYLSKPVLWGHPVLSSLQGRRKKGRGREKSTKEGKGKGAFPSLPNPPPFFPFSLSPTPFDACYAGYVLSRHYSIPRWCLLNTGFTVSLKQFIKHISKTFSLW